MVWLIVFGVILAFLGNLNEYLDLNSDTDSEASDSPEDLDNFFDCLDNN